MIQDIAPHRLYNHYDPGIRPEPDSYVMIFRGGGEVLLSDTPGRVVYPRVRELFGEEIPPLRYLFSIDADRYFLCREETACGAVPDRHTDGPDGGLRIPDGFHFHNVRTLRRMDLSPREAIFAAFTGEQIYRWYRDNRFCGRCGTPTAHDGKERMMRCPNCGNMIFPRIAPAAIIALTHGNKLMLSKYANRN